MNFMVGVGLRFTRAQAIGIPDSRQTTSRWPLSNDQVMFFAPPSAALLELIASEEPPKNIPAS